MIRRATIRNRSRSRRGAGLVDAVLAALLMFSSAFAFAATLSTCNTLVAKNRHMEIATNAGCMELEARRAAGYDSIPHGPAAVTLTPEQLLRSLPAALPNASATLVVRRMETVGAAPNFSYQGTTLDTGRLHLEMTVRWQGRGGDRGAVTVRGLLLR